MLRAALSKKSSNPSDSRLVLKTSDVIQYNLDNVFSVGFISEIHQGRRDIMQDKTFLKVDNSMHDSCFNSDTVVKKLGHISVGSETKGEGGIITCSVEDAWTQCHHLSDCELEDGKVSSQYYVKYSSSHLIADTLIYDPWIKAYVQSKWGSVISSMNHIIELGSSSDDDSVEVIWCGDKYNSGGNMVSKSSSNVTKSSSNVNMNPLVSSKKSDTNEFSEDSSIIEVFSAGN